MSKKDFVSNILFIKKGKKSKKTTTHSHNEFTEALNKYKNRIFLKKLHANWPATLSFTHKSLFYLHVALGECEFWLNESAKKVTDEKKARSGALLRLRMCVSG